MRARGLGRVRGAQRADADGAGTARCGCGLTGSPDVDGGAGSEPAAIDPGDVSSTDADADGTTDSAGRDGNDFVGGCASAVAPIGGRAGDSVTAHVAPSIGGTGGMIARRRSSSLENTIRAGGGSVANSSARRRA